MVPLESAIHELRQVLAAGRDSPEWRWLVRGRLSELKEALGTQQVRQWDGWLSARAQSSVTERRRLRARVTALAATVLTRRDSEGVTRELSRLLGDLDRHVQRVHDLVYDSVSLEIGGSD